MKIYKAIDGFILTLKVISVLFFSSIFLYWSINAIIKYRSNPTLSTVAYKFGDDGHGNFEFPAITICLDTFNWITLSPGMKNNCSRLTKIKMLFSGKDKYLDFGIHTFYDALKRCTAENDVTTQTSQKSGEDDGEKNEIVDYYKKLDDLLHITNMTVEITDIVSRFIFGTLFGGANSRNISASSYGSKDLMKKLWEPTLHFEKGICYTFDPKLHGKFQVNPERLLRAHIDFDVGELFSVCIYFS